MTASKGRIFMSGIEPASIDTVSEAILKNVGRITDDLIDALENIDEAGLSYQYVTVSVSMTVVPKDGGAPFAITLEVGNPKAQEDYD